MKSGHIMALLVACLLGGWFYPDLAGMELGRAPVTDTSVHLTDAGKSAPKASAETAQAHWLAGEVALPRHNDGHFYADVMANGTPLRMVVDTGASMVALTGEDARAMGLSWDEQDLGIVAHGASGPVEGIATKIDRLELDGIEARNVHAVVIPEGLAISLLGQTFLSEVQRVEIVNDEMVLGD